MCRACVVDLWCLCIANYGVNGEPSETQIPAFQTPPMPGQWEAHLWSGARAGADLTAGQESPASPLRLLSCPGMAVLGSSPGELIGGVDWHRLLRLCAAARHRALLGDLKPCAQAVLSRWGCLDVKPLSSWPCFGVDPCFPG